MSHPIRIEGSPEHQALQRYRTRLDGALDRLGFTADTIAGIRQRDCIPFLHASWDKPDKTPTLPRRLAAKISKVATSGLLVAEVALSYDFAQVRMAGKQFDGQYNPRIFEIGQGDYPDTDIDPWMQFDFRAGEITATHYAITGDFPGTYDRTRQVRESLVMTDIEELGTLIQASTTAPFRGALSRPTI